MTICSWATRRATDSSQVWEPRYEAIFRDANGNIKSLDGPDMEHDSADIADYTKDDFIFYTKGLW